MSQAPCKDRGLEKFCVSRVGALPLPPSRALPSVWSWAGGGARGLGLTWATHDGRVASRGLHGGGLAPDWEGPQERSVPQSRAAGSPRGWTVRGRGSVVPWGWEPEDSLLGPAGAARGRLLRLLTWTCQALALSVTVSFPRWAFRRRGSSEADDLCCLGSGGAGAGTRGCHAGRGPVSRTWGLLCRPSGRGPRSP